MTNMSRVIICYWYIL